MKIKITIDTNNAAFEDCGTGPEVARILKQLAEDLDFCDCIGPGQEIPLRDCNGNTCGLLETV